MSAPGTPREPLWTAEEIEYLRQHYASQPLRGIAAALGRPRPGVASKARKLGISKRPTPRPWTAEDEAYLAANYEHATTMEIARALGRRHGNVKAHADRLGLMSLKRNAQAAVRHDYFSEVSRPVQAYVLGLLASDGWVATGRNELGIALGAKDAGLVNLVRDELAPLSRVYLTSSGRADFRISSAQLRVDLARLGVTSRKTLTIQWPAALPEHLANSYICGFFDGDGCLWIAKQGRQVYYAWSITCASRPLLEEFRRRLRAATGVKVGGPYAVAAHNRALVIRYGGPSTHLLDEWLHADVPGLARKRPGGLPCEVA